MTAGGASGVDIYAYTIMKTAVNFIQSSLHGLRHLLDGR